MQNIQTKENNTQGDNIKYNKALCRYCTRLLCFIVCKLVVVIRIAGIFPS